ncbi:hypothetical protein K1719_012772 [Acacia pycnantha]|nr:hypothetical protein K1719_012772 [Acacia pycnantha]
MTVDVFKSVMIVREKVDEGTPKLILPRGPLGNCAFIGEYDEIPLTLRCTIVVFLNPKQSQARMLIALEEALLGQLLETSCQKESDRKGPDPELGQRDTFVSLGGGVIGDICGFAASQFLRGVNFIQIPTTVMAQVYYCELASGLAEVIKYGEVISLDEKESWTGATLNLGHTFGDAIETKGGYGQWLHGEAVAAGTVVAVDLSHHLGLIDDSSVQ